MGKRTIFLSSVLIFILALLSYKATFALFSDSATSTNNLFAAASVFPSLSPTATATASASVSPSPTGEPTPTPDPFADEVTAVTGTFGHCCSDLSSDPGVAALLVTGAPDSPPDSDFIQISDSSSITLRFVDNKAVAGAGPDIKIHVYDTLFPAHALIEVSPDGGTYTTAFASAEDTADVDIDLNTLGLTEAKFIKITDLVEVGDPFPTLGFDLDAVEALNNAAP